MSVFVDVCLFGTFVTKLLNFNYSYSTKHEGRVRFIHNQTF